VLGPALEDASAVKVAEIMSRDVVGVSPALSLKDVAELLQSRRISGVPVVTANGILIGVVSEGDIVAKARGVSVDPDVRSNWLFGPDESDALKREAQTAADAMSLPPITIEPQKSVAEAARVLVARGVNRLPVVEGGRLVGIVTRADIVRAFTRPDREIGDEIRDDVLSRMLWIDPSTIAVHVDEGAVRLAGNIPTRSSCEFARKLVALVPGVVSVDASELSWNRDDVRRHGLVARLLARRRAVAT
jgi:CBS-domain-containing membrane protein